MPLKRLLTGKSFLLEATLKYLVAALLVFIPLYPKFPLFNVSGTYVAIRAEDFLIVLLGLVLICLFTRYRRLVFSSFTFRCLLVYWSVGLLSTLSGIFLTHTVTSPLLGLLHFARRIEYALPFIAGLILVQDTRNLKFFLEIIPLVALGVFGYGIAQIYFEAPVIITQNEEYSKGFALTLQPGVNLASTFAGHYDLATYLVLVLSLITAAIFALKNHRLQLAGLGLFLLLFWLQLQTGSRIALFALLVSLSLVFLLSRRLIWIIPFYLLLLVGLANTPNLSGRFDRLFQVVRLKYLQQQVQGIFHTRSQLLIAPAYAAVPASEGGPATTDQPVPTPTPTLRPIQQDRSTSIRFDVEWPRAIRAFSKNPFLGTGFSSLTLATDNDYLRALGETGLLGLLAFLAVIFGLIADILRGLRAGLISLDHQYLVGIGSGLLGFLIIASFIDVFEASKVATLFWLFTGFSTGLILRHEK